MKDLNKCLLFNLIILSFFGKVNSQCLPIDFTVPSSVCLNQSIVPDNLSGSGTYLWDFCTGDLANIPTAKSFYQIPNAGGRPGIELAKDGSIWYGFVTGSSSNELYRLQFGGGLNSSPSIIENMGNVGDVLNVPGQVRIFKENNLWYGIIHNTGTGDLVKLQFGITLSNTPVSSLLPIGIAYFNGGFALAKDPVNGWTCIISNAANQIVSIRLGSTIKAPGPSDILISPTVPNPNTLGDVDLIQVCNKWFGFASNLGDGNIYRLKFGSSIFSVPIIEQIASLPVANLGRIRVARDGDSYFLFCTALDGLFFKLVFGNDPSKPPSISNEGNLNGVLPGNIYALSVAKENSTWTIIAASQGTGKAFAILYPNNCSANPQTSDQFNPNFTYQSTGNYNISLDIASFSGSATKTLPITVSSLFAPDINLSYQNICVNSNVNFNPINSSGNLALYNWNFGDTNTSPQPNPTHIYSSASTYPVTLQVTATNGCNNIAKSDVAIYNKPAADFSFPTASQFCTNQNYVFTNQSVFDAPSSPTWEWRLNGTLVSSTQDLTQAFTSTTSQEIRLKARIPGCENEVIKNVSTLIPGPLVNFTAPATACQSAPVSFTNATTGSVTGYQWTFGDGNTSSSANATNTYTNIGSYNVTLQGNNAAGCQNTVTKSITVYTKPQPDFSVGLPPFSCAGTVSQFTDATPTPTDSNITGWQWAFGDPANGTSTLRNPTYTYPLAGTYNVSLSTSTNFGCTNSLTKSITISPSPIANFTNAVACINQPTQFTDASTGSIRSRLWTIQSNSFSSPGVQFSFANAGSFPVSLTITGNNNCVSQFSKTINVPVQPSLDFSIQAPCTTNPTVFSEITSGVDVPVSQLWNFGGLGNSMGASAQFVFTTPNNYSVQLRSTRQSGCTYSITKNVSITQGPVADFIPSVDIGGPPLAVSFANTSTNANSYLWKFGDANNTTSTQTNPNFTFTDLGVYAVKLTAFNGVGCSFTTSKPITILVPSINVVLSDFSLVPDQQTGVLQPMLNILNKSNVPITNPDVLLDVESSGLIKKKVIAKIQPNQSLSVAVDLQIVPRSATYICAEVDIANNIAAFDKRRCLPLSSTEVLFSPYPNPAKDNLNFDWISNEALPVNVVIFTSVGSTVFQQKFTSVATGLNRLELNTSTLPNGLYYINYSDSKTTRSFSFTIAK